MYFIFQQQRWRYSIHSGGVGVTGTLLVGAVAADVEMHDYELESRASNPR